VLNLYLISRDDHDYDEDDSAVIAAATPKLARELAESGLSGPKGVWAHGKAKLQKIGVAGPRVKQGVVLNSYNAG
jgi:hypothetical protein